ncbi:hypothetical protein BU15DRAFT_62893 [Melanogaster broomeanus]|nr:hypothetical protein BU15DRAFT_62893 [Melanogaster broomeanus]
MVAAWRSTKDDHHSDSDSESRPSTPSRVVNKKKNGVSSTTTRPDATRKIKSISSRSKNSSKEGVGKRRVYSNMRSKFDSDSKHDVCVHAARWIPRAFDMYCNLDEVIQIYLLVEDEASDTYDDNAEDEKAKAARRRVLQKVGGPEAIKRHQRVFEYLKEYAPYLMGLLRCRALFNDKHGLGGANARGDYDSDDDEDDLVLMKRQVAARRARLASSPDPPAQATVGSPLRHTPSSTAAPLTSLPRTIPSSPLVQPRRSPPPLSPPPRNVPKGKRKQTEDVPDHWDTGSPLSEAPNGDTENDIQQPQPKHKKTSGARKGTSRAGTRKSSRLKK